MSASFEPGITGSDRKGDVLLRGTGQAQLVETRTLLRAEPEVTWQDYEDSLSRALNQIEIAHCVSTRTRLNGHLDGPETAAWLTQIAGAAERVGASGAPETVVTEAVEVVVDQHVPTDGAAKFVGAPWVADGWRRLGRALQEKARQSAGPDPAWLRIDAADGFFQFTDWTRHPWPGRICELCDVFAGEGLDGFAHLQGVVLSCGPAVCSGAIDPLAEYQDAEVGGVVGLRRLLAPHLVRETFIIPVRAEAAPWAGQWGDGYRTEPGWLDDDLARLGLAPVSACWGI